MNRDESGAEIFRLFRGKTETDWKYENENGTLQNGNKNGNFLAEMEIEMETETEQRFPAEQAWKRNFCFRLIRNFRFSVDVHGPIQHAYYMTLSS